MSVQVSKELRVSGIRWKCLNEDQWTLNQNFGGHPLINLVLGREGRWGGDMFFKSVEVSGVDSKYINGFMIYVRKRRIWIIDLCILICKTSWSARRCPWNEIQNFKFKNKIILKNLFLKKKNNKFWFFLVYVTPRVHMGSLKKN